jgi:HKD family nuclease
MCVGLLFQTPGSPVILDRLAGIISAGNYRRFRIAVAFATYAGVVLIQRLLNQRDSPIEVLALVGLDRNITEPEALKRLREDDRVSLRVFRSAPTTMFHAKAYFFDGEEDPTLLVGSCNLSKAAFTQNRESAIWLSGPAELFTEWEEWWEVLWSSAEPLTNELLAEYRARYEVDRNGASDNQNHGDSESLTSSAAQGDRLWLGTGSMTGGAVSQLELPRETAAFFLDEADTNATVELTLIRGSMSWPNNHMAFYQNEMWRINLSTEIPEVEAKSLPYKYVLFERTDVRDTYRFDVVDEEDRAELRMASEALEQYGQTMSRDFGWL